MRTLAALLVALAVAVLPASAGFAAASMNPSDCMHAAATDEHAGHGQRDAGGPDHNAVCCALHCAVIGGPADPALMASPTLLGFFATPALPFFGADIEPALPPPRNTVVRS